MNPILAENIIELAIRKAERRAFNRLVAKHRKAGSATPMLAASEEYRAIDDGVTYGTVVATDISNAARIAMATVVVVGSGKAIAYVGGKGGYTIIRETATPDEIELATINCLNLSSEDL